MVKRESFLIFRELNKYIILSIGSFKPLPRYGFHKCEYICICICCGTGWVLLYCMCNFCSRMFLYILSSFLTKFAILLILTHHVTRNISIFRYSVIRRHRYKKDEHPPFAISTRIDMGHNLNQDI